MGSIEQQYVCEEWGTGATGGWWGRDGKLDLMGVVEGGVAKGLL